MKEYQKWGDIKRSKEPRAEGTHEPWQVSFLYIATSLYYKRVKTEGEQLALSAVADAIEKESAWLSPEIRGSLLRAVELVNESPCKVEVTNRVLAADKQNRDLADLAYLFACGYQAWHD